MRHTALAKKNKENFMKLTKEQVLEIYKKNKRNNDKLVIAMSGDLVCSYTTKKFKKAVFFTQELDHQLFDKYCRIKNDMKADKIVVYCEYAYILSPNTLEIVLNRDTGLESVR